MPRINVTPSAAGGGGGGTQRPELPLTRPRVGEYLAPFSGGNTTTTLVSTTLGLVYYMPVDVAASTTFDAAAFNVATAGAGTGLAVRVGVFADDGTYTYPTGAALYEPAATADPTTTGDKILTFAAPIALPAGRYWLAATLQGTTVTTAPTLVTLTGPTFGMPLTALTNSSFRTVTTTGATGPLTGYTVPATFARTGTAILLVLRRSA